jgi:hypothetical protein
MDLLYSVFIHDLSKWTERSSTVLAHATDKWTCIIEGLKNTQRDYERDRKQVRHLLALDIFLHQRSYVLILISVCHLLKISRPSGSVTWKFSKR